MSFSPSVNLAIATNAVNHVLSPSNFTTTNTAIFSSLNSSLDQLEKKANLVINLDSYSKFAQQYSLNQAEAINSLNDYISNAVKVSSSSQTIAYSAKHNIIFCKGNSFDGLPQPYELFFHLSANQVTVKIANNPATTVDIPPAKAKDFVQHLQTKFHPNIERLKTDTVKIMELEKVIANEIENFKVTWISLTEKQVKATSEKLLQTFMKDLQKDSNELASKVKSALADQYKSLIKQSEQAKAQGLEKTLELSNKPSINPKDIEKIVTQGNNVQQAHDLKVATANDIAKQSAVIQDAGKAKAQDQEMLKQATQAENIAKAKLSDTLDKTEGKAIIAAQQAKDASKTYTKIEEGAIELKQEAEQKAAENIRQATIYNKAAQEANLKDIEKIITQENKVQQAHDLKVATANDIAKQSAVIQDAGKAKAQDQELKAAATNDIAKQSAVIQDAGKAKAQDQEMLKQATQAENIAKAKLSDTLDKTEGKAIIAAQQAKDASKTYTKIEEGAIELKQEAEQKAAENIRQATIYNKAAQEANLKDIEKIITQGNNVQQAHDLKVATANDIAKQSAVIQDAEKAKAQDQEMLKQATQAENIAKAKLSDTLDKTEGKAIIAAQQAKDASKIYTKIEERAIELKQEAEQKAAENIRQATIYNKAAQEAREKATSEAQKADNNSAVAQFAHDVKQEVEKNPQPGQEIKQQEENSFLPKFLSILPEALEDAQQKMTGLVSDLEVPSGTAYGQENDF
jgi:hypothetical protein